MREINRWKGGSEPASMPRRWFLREASFALGAMLVARPAVAVIPTDCAQPQPSGAPVKFRPDPSLPMRVRKSAFDLSDTETKRLRAAYAALRKLTEDNPNDPRGWLQQGNVHCNYCGGADSAGQDIHSSWWFFPWHRCFLYFHERILAERVGDDQLSLPYWPWDVDGFRAMPPAYATPPASTPNSLFDDNRKMQPGSLLPPEIVGPAAMQRALAPNSADEFLGTNDGDGGSLEFGPHGAVHLWVGAAALDRGTPDMGVLQTAAQDPVFFAHHGNIDRLWDAWLRMAPMHNNPSQSEWLDHTWTFFNEQGVWTSISVRDVIDHETSLRYRYEPPRGGAPPVVAMGPGMKSVTAVNALGPLSVVASKTPIPLGVTPVTHVIKLPSAFQKQFQALAAEVSARPRSVLLRIEGIDVPPTDASTFRVFIDNPDAGPRTPIDIPNYVGYFVAVPKIVHGAVHRHAAHNAVFDITQNLRELKKASPELAVTLVPLRDVSTAPQRNTLTYKAIMLSTQ